MAAAAADYPLATEVLVSFPEAWELVARLDAAAGERRYVAAMPPQRERPRRHRFHGLPAEINKSLETYRLYKLFRPRLLRSVTLAWDAATQAGRIMGFRDLRLELVPAGQAQAWHGREEAVLWECYLSGLERPAGWQDELAAFWLTVEGDLGAGQLYTLPHEPTFREGYTPFLSRLGYAPDPDGRGWWSKRRQS